MHKNDQCVEQSYSSDYHVHPRSKFLGQSDIGASDLWKLCFLLSVHADLQHKKCRHKRLRCLAHVQSNDRFRNWHDGPYPCGHLQLQSRPDRLLKRCHKFIGHILCHNQDKECHRNHYEHLTCCLDIPSQRSNLACRLADLLLVSDSICDRIHLRYYRRS